MTKTWEFAIILAAALSLASCATKPPVIPQGPKEPTAMEEFDKQYRKSRKYKAEGRYTEAFKEIAEGR